MLLKQLTSLKCLLRQSLAIKGHKDLLQLLMLRSNDWPELKTWIQERQYFSPVILNEQIVLMGLSVSREPLVDIRRSEWFSVIADEATDLSQNEQLTLCIRWVDNDIEIHKDPVELIHVPKTDSSTFTDPIKDSLVRLCLPLSCCRGQAYDGAANMSGHWHDSYDSEGCAICSVRSVVFI